MGTLTTTSTPTRPDVLTWAEDLPDAYLNCRTLLHAWRAYTARYVPEDHCYEQVVRCTRCKTRRIETLSQTGHLQSRRYDYPDDYLAPKGTGAIVGSERDSLRLTSVLRRVRAGLVDHG